MSVIGNIRRKIKEFPQSKRFRTYNFNSVSRHTISTYLALMVRTGEIERVQRGVYIKSKSYEKTYYHFNRFNIN
jgi:hypothetical protein